MLKINKYTIYMYSSINLVDGHYKLKNTHYNPNIDALRDHSSFTCHFFHTLQISGKFKGKANDLDLSLDDLVELLHSVDHHKVVDNSGGAVISDEQLEALLDRTLTSQEKNKQKERSDQTSKEQNLFRVIEERDAKGNVTREDDDNATPTTDNWHIVTESEKKSSTSEVNEKENSSRSASCDGEKVVDEKSNDSIAESGLSCVESAVSTSLMKGADRSEGEVSSSVPLPTEPAEKMQVDEQEQATATSEAENSSLCPLEAAGSTITENGSEMSGNDKHSPQLNNATTNNTQLSTEAEVSACDGSDSVAMENDICKLVLPENESTTAPPTALMSEV